MKIDDLLNKSGEWLKGTGAESDVVISTRVRLARNLQQYIFLTKAPPELWSEINSYIKGKLQEKRFPRKLFYFPINKLNPLDRHFLIERHLISKEHASGDRERGVVFDQDEVISIMINEEDHLRMQVLRSGLQCDDAWEEISATDSILEESFSFAFSPRFGYLTCCPTNVGTGLRISTLLHLPALAITKQIEKVFQSLARINCSVRGLFGEGSPASGDFYQISNQSTLGKSETDILNEIKNIVPQVIQYERVWRKKLLEDQQKKLEDRVWRAYGILKNARTITSEESIEMLSVLRLGINLELIEGIPIKVINELFIFTQPAHLQKLEGRPLEPAERDVIRANFIRVKLE
jgi:protein arginine kinase